MSDTKAVKLTRECMPEELADWRYQCEERIRRWAQGRCTPEWHLPERDLLRLLDDHHTLARAVLAWHEVFGHLSADPDTAGNLLNEKQHELEQARDAARAEVERYRRVVLYPCGCPRDVGQAISCNGCGTLREVPSRAALGGEARSHLREGECPSCHSIGAYRQHANEDNPWCHSCGYFDAALGVEG